MNEVRDDRGRLIYATRSNHGLACDAMFDGPKRAIPRTSSSNQGTLTPTRRLEGDWVPERDSAYTVPGGRSR
jgi:hypothetical protein